MSPVEVLAILSAVITPLVGAVVYLYKRTEDHYRDVKRKLEQCETNHRATEQEAAELRAKLDYLTEQFRQAGITIHLSEIDIVDGKIFEREDEK